MGYSEIGYGKHIMDATYLSNQSYNRLSFVCSTKKKRAGVILGGKCKYRTWRCSFCFCHNQSPSHTQSLWHWNNIIIIRPALYHFYLQDVFFRLSCKYGKLPIQFVVVVVFPLIKFNRTRKFYSLIIDVMTNWDLRVDTKFTELFKAGYLQIPFYLLFTYYFRVIFTYHKKKGK